MSHANSKGTYMLVCTPVEHHCPSIYSTVLTESVSGSYERVCMLIWAPAVCICDKWQYSILCINWCCCSLYKCSTVHKCIFERLLTKKATSIKYVSFSYLHERQQCLSNQETCPLSVSACCPNERSLLRSINEVKGHQVRQYVKWIKYCGKEEKLLLFSTKFSTYL